MNTIGIELSNQCNLKCEICARHFIPQKEKHMLTPKQIEKIKFHEVKTLKKINIVGFRGDALTNPHLLDILDILKGDFSISIGTNGNFYDKNWWYKLPGHLPCQHSIYFALDGTDNETLNKYRKGSNYERVIGNVEAFIAGGGTAIWQMIKFKHNEHQFDEAKEIAERMGMNIIFLASTKYFPPYERPSTGLLSDLEFTEANREKAWCRIQFGKIAISSMGEYLPCCLCFTPDDILEVSGEPIKYIEDYSLPELIADGYWDRILKRVLTKTVKYCNNECNLYCGMRNI